MSKVTNRHRSDTWTMTGFVMSAAATGYLTTYRAERADNLAHICQAATGNSTQRYGMKKSLPPLLPTAAAMSATSGRIHLKPRPRSMRSFAASSRSSTCPKVPFVHPQAAYSVAERLAYNLDRTSLPNTATLYMFRPIVDDVLVELADMPFSSALPYETSTRKENISSPTSPKCDWPEDDFPFDTAQRDGRLPYFPMLNPSVSGTVALQP
jgi:hypothetical protein